MTTETIALIFLFSIIPISIIVNFSTKAHDRKITEQVKLLSPMYKNLIALNKETKFDNNIKSSYPISNDFNSKAKFDRYSVSSYFEETLIDDINFYKSIIDRVKNNRKLWKDYKYSYASLYQLSDSTIVSASKINIEKFHTIEKLLFEETKLSTRLTTNITCTLYYRSPQGRNFYQKQGIYPFSLLEFKCNIASDEIASRQTRENLIRIERSKVTESLRYDILRRDNFKCQICGASASDGAKLHVDHIIPVSRGGKSDKSNLRTLCSRCNIGKSNKIE